MLLLLQPMISLLLLFSQMPFLSAQIVPKPCPVRIVSHRILAASNAPGGQNDGGTAQTNIWRQFSTDKKNIYNQQHQQMESTVEMPGANNSALLYRQDFREHYEPDSESSLTANFKCQFIFIGAVDERVQIIFHWFRLQLSSNERRRQQNKTALRCEESDHLSAHVLLEDRMSKIVDFCGDELPAQLMSARNVLTLTYTLKSSLMKQRMQFLAERQLHEEEQAAEHGGMWHGPPMKAQQDHFGWVAEYRFLTDYGVQPAEAILQEEENRTCSFLFNGTLKTTGNVWSPNYPGFYPRNADCQYVFIGSGDQIVLVTFEYFDIEGYGQCDDLTQSDFVLFSNYKTRDRTNRRFCGSLRPKGAVQSESNYFRMIFHSNDIFDGTGFFARYQFFSEKSSKNHVKLAASSSSSAGGIWPKHSETMMRTMAFLIIFFFPHIFCYELVN